MFPDIDENIVVWQDNRNGNWDIYGYNLLTGEEFQISGLPAKAKISGEMAVKKVPNTKAI